MQIKDESEIKCFELLNEIEQTFLSGFDVCYMGIQVWTIKIFPDVLYSLA